MSKDIWSDDEFTEFSYRTNEHRYTGVYLGREYLDSISIVVPQNIPERIEETINENTGVVHTFGQINQLGQNSATTPLPLINTDGSNGTPISLNAECGEPVVESYYRNNTAHTPLDMNNVVSIPNIRIKSPSNCDNQNRYYNRSYFATSFQHFTSAEKRESGQLSPYSIENTNPFNSTKSSSPDGYQDSLNNDDVICIEEYDRCSSRMSTSSSSRCESVIKYCQPTENKWENFNKLKCDPRLINRDRNTYRLDNFEGLKPLSYTDKETYSDEDLRIIDKKLKNMNSSHKFGVVNDLRSVDDSNKHSIISYSQSDPRIKKTLLDRESITSIDCNKHLIFNAKGCNNLNVGNEMDVIDLSNDDVDLVNDIETTKTPNIFEQYLKKKNELRKFREEEQKEVAEIVDNIIVNLNEDMSDLRCITRKCSMKNDGMIKTHDFNDQTKYNIKETNENILTVENFNVDDNTHQNVDNMVGLIGTHQNHKQLSGRTIELIDLTNEDTADSRVDQDVDTGMFISKMKDKILMSTANEDEKINKSSENSENHPINKNETNAENILNENHSVIDQRKTSEKKSSKRKSKKRNKSKDNYKHSETYKDRNSNKTDSSVIQIDSAFENNNSELAINSCQMSDEQTNNAEMWTKPFKQQNKTDKNELINEPDGVVQHGNETLTNNNNNKKFMKNACEIIESIKNEKHGLVDSTNSGIYVGVQSNPNTSTKSATPVLDVDEKIHYNHDQLSIRVQDPNKTTGFNFPNKHRKSSIYFEKRVPGTNGILKQTTNDDSLKSNIVQLLSNPKQSFENVNDEQCMSYHTEYQNSNTNETDIYESPEDASESQTVDSIYFGNSPYADREYNSTLDVGKEVPPYIKLSESILNENSKSCEHFEMDYFYNIIKINPSLFRVNLHTEDDIFNFIQLYSQRTQTSWRVLKSSKSQKYDICKVFGCLHNGLFKLLKKPDKRVKPNKCECQSEIDIKIKCSTVRGKNKDPYLKNGLPAIVRLKNDHNHLVTELPLLKSITDNNIEITFDEGLEPAKIREACNIGSSPNSSTPVIDITNLSDDDAETTGLDTSDPITENNLFSRWKDVRIERDIVKTGDNGGLQSGLLVINSDELANEKATSHQLVDTSYNKDYCRKLKGMMSDHVKAKWLSDKMTTEADQVSLYKCSGKKCNAVFKRRRTFVSHLNDHCRNSKIQKKTLQFMTCMYCFKSFDKISIDALADHIYDNYNFCKYFCQYCLYRANTASHVLVHEYTTHREQKPSILKLEDRAVYGNSNDVLKVVDFNKFVPRYVCNFGDCSFYSYMDSDFLYHLSHDHVDCDQFYCDICDQSNENGFVALNPISFVKHFTSHNMNTYQCIFCLFGTETTNLMIIHLAMEHFEYEPFCLERLPINTFCDNKNIENLTILNIKKSIPAGIIKIVNGKSLKDLNKKKCQPNPSDTICTNEKSVNIGNTTRVSRRSLKEVVRPSKNTIKLTIDNKNNTVISEEAKRNVPRKSQRILNIASSKVNEKKKPSQMSIYEIMNNSELKKNFGKPFKEKGLKIPTSDEMIDEFQKYAKKRLDNTCKNNGIRQTRSGNRYTNTKTVEIENTTQLSRRTSKKTVHPPKNTKEPEIDNKNNKVISDEAKRNVPRDDAKQISNSGASIENDKYESSQLSIHDIRKNKKTNPEIDNKNNTVVSDEAKRNVPRDDAKQISNSEASIENDKYESSQLSIHDIRKNKNTNPEIDNKNNTVVSDEVKRNVQRDSAKRISNSGASIENDKNESSQLSIDDIRKNKKTNPEIDNKNNTVVSDEAKRKYVPRDDAKRISNSRASIENDKNESSQLSVHDIRKNKNTNPEIDNKNNTVVSDEAKRNVPRDDAKRISNSGASTENDKNESSQLSVRDIRKNKKTNPEIDNKNNTVVSDEAKKNVPRDDAKRISNSRASIENDKNESSQLSVRDIRKNKKTNPEIDNKNNTVVSDEAKRKYVPRDDAKRIPKSVTSIENEKNKSSQLAIHDIRKNKKTNPEIDNKNNTVVSDEAKRNVPRYDAKRISNSGASIENDKNESSQLSVRDIRKNKKTNPEIDNKNNTIVSDEAKRKYIPREDAKRISNSGASIENDKNESSQLSVRDIRKNKKTNPEIDNKNNTVVSDEAKRNVPRDDAKRIPKSVTSIENEKNKSSQLAIHDIRKNKKTNPEIDNKNNTVVSEEAKRNVPRDDAKRISNSGASIENDKNESSQLSIHDIVKIIKSKKAIRKPVKEESLETTSSDEPIDQHKVIPAEISYQDHLNKCPMESPMKCTFCLAQSESTFDVIKIPRLLVPNRFTCTFCNLELPSSDTTKSHLKEVHNVSNVQFVPVDSDMNDIEKDRFLVCEDKCLKGQKRANDSSFYTEICKNMTVANKKRSKVVTENDDFQLTSIENTTNTSKQQVERTPDDSQQQHKTMKRKYSNDTTNNVADIDYKKTPCWKRLYDTIQGVTISMYFSPRNIKNIPQTQYFSKPVGCLLCHYHTKVRSSLVSHLNRHGVESVSYKHISSSVPYKLKPAATPTEPVNNSPCSSFEPKQNEKAKRVIKNIYGSNTNTIKPPSSKLENFIPECVPITKRFKCAVPKCNHLCEDLVLLENHIKKYHSKFPYLVCPHCKPSVVKFNNFRELESHINFHGANLYMCQYCNYFHYNNLKIKSHQTRKHPLQMDGENNLNVVTIRESNISDMQTSKWQCNICIPGIKYTLTQITAHLSIVHKISKIFRCYICQFGSNYYEVFEQHFMLDHPNLEMTYNSVHFKKISPDVELEPAGKQTEVGIRGTTKESHLLNVKEAFDGVAEPMTALPSPQETSIKSTSVCKTPAESLVVSGNQGEILDKISNEPDINSNFLMCPMAKYECPICIVFEVEETECFRRHLLNEINCTLWMCMECFTIRNSEIKIKIHLLKHNQTDRLFEEIDISKKNILVDGIIEYQNMIIDHKVLKKKRLTYQLNNQNGTKHGNVQ